jgi:hypothetical protein
MDSKVHARGRSTQSGRQICQMQSCGTYQRVPKRLAVGGARKIPDLWQMKSLHSHSRLGVFFALFVSLGVLSCSGAESRWRDRLNSEDHAVADQAFLKLYQYGPAAFEDLSTLFESDALFRGTAFIDDFAATMAPRGSTPVRMVALCLMHSILVNRLYYRCRDPFLYGKDGSPAKEADVKRLIVEYRALIASSREGWRSSNGNDPVLHKSGMVWGSRHRGLVGKSQNKGQR